MTEQEKIPTKHPHDLIEWLPEDGFEEEETETASESESEIIVED